MGRRYRIGGWCGPCGGQGVLCSAVLCYKLPVLKVVGAALTSSRLQEILEEGFSLLTIGRILCWFMPHETGKTEMTY